MKASDLIRLAHVTLRKRDNDLTGLSLKMIREFDADRAREETSERNRLSAEAIRRLVLFHMSCSPTVH